MREMLDQKLDRYIELEKQMSDPEVQGNPGKMAAVAREHGSLAKLAGKYRRFKAVINELDELREMAQSDDSDEREMAEMEITTLTEEREEIWAGLLDMTIGGEDANRTKCVMEIRAGTGGDEAALFAGNLLTMYQKHCESKKWKLETFDSSPNEIGGFKEVTIGIEGEGVYRELQYESGGHRVQRVPETETKGRIHTSAG
jgi:peptide chain release factor 1